MARRSNYDLEKDVRRIKEAAKTAHSFKEIAEITGLSVSQVETSLKKHPTIRRRIKSSLLCDNVDVTNTKVSTLNQELSEKDKAVSEKTQASVFLPNLPYGKVVVMDTSVSGIGGMISLLRAQKEVIVLDAVIRELKGIKNLTSKSKSGAANYLHELAHGNKPFVSIAADETCMTVDDTVIRYCVKRKKEVILFTADQEMAALARGYGINVLFFERKPISPDCIPRLEEEKPIPVYKKSFVSQTVSEEITQYDGIEYKKGKLFLAVKDVRNRKFMAVCSGGTITRRGDVWLHVGDDILIAKRKEDYFSFSHFKVISTGKYNNSRLVYTAKIFDISQVDLLPNTHYISLMKEFIEAYKPEK